MSRGAPTRECPGCHQRLHVRKKSCDCGYNFPAYGSISPTKVESPIDKPEKCAILPPVSVAPTQSDDRLLQECMRRLRHLEEREIERDKKMAFLVSLSREMLKICRAFNQVPSSLALMLKDDKWFGMNDEREVRPVNISEPEISFALDGNNTREVMAAPWEDDFTA